MLKSVNSFSIYTPDQNRGDETNFIMLRFYTDVYSGERLLDLLDQLDMLDSVVFVPIFLHDLYQKRENRRVVVVTKTFNVFMTEYDAAILIRLEHECIAADRTKLFIEYKDEALKCDS